MGGERHEITRSCEVRIAGVATTMAVGGVAVYK